MIRTRSKGRQAEPEDRRALAYIRVSSDAQTEFSPDAQRSNVASYAERHGLTVVEWFAEAKSAASAGKRPEFARLLKAITAKGAPRVILFDKADRSARNLPDYAALDALLRSHGVTLHFVRDGLVVSQHGHRGPRLLWGFLMHLAKDFSENLSEEVKKGMHEKAARGLWVGGNPPRGYTIDADDVLQPDPDTAPLIRAIFLRSIEGDSVQVLATWAQSQGLRISRTNIAWTLRNVVYRGDVSWGGRVHPGKHVGLVTRDEWEAAQREITRRRAGGGRGGVSQHHELRGMLVCGSCGCAMTGAAKMGGRWVGYRCTGRRTAGKPCGPYLRERDAVAAIKSQMHRLTLTDDFVEGVRAEIIREHSEDSDFRRAESSRLGRERSRLETRIDGAYLDALDGRITRAEFDRLASGWRADLERVTRELAALGTATDETMARALRALELARDVGRLYAVAAGGDDRRGVLMEYVSRVVWADGIATLEFRQPYDAMAVSVETLRECPSGKGDGTMLELAAAILRWARAA